MRSAGIYLPQKEVENMAHHPSIEPLDQMLLVQGRLIEIGMEWWRISATALLKDWWRYGGPEYLWGPLDQAPPARKPPGYYYRLARVMH
jgi:hypothetical protein